MLLVSMPQMNDPNFAKTVILLCDYTTDGAFGLVVNRQMTDPAWTLVKPETPVHVDPSVHLWIGGPVDQQRTWVLMSEAQGPEEDQREICPGVLLSASQALTLQLLQSPPTNKVRVIAGYSGWGAGQLEQLALPVLQGSGDCRRQNDVFVGVDPIAAIEQRHRVFRRPGVLIDYPLDVEVGFEFRAGRGRHPPGLEFALHGRNRPGAHPAPARGTHPRRNVDRNVGNRPRG